MVNLAAVAAFAILAAGPALAGDPRGGGHGGGYSGGGCGGGCGGGGHRPPAHGGGHVGNINVNVNANANANAFAGAGAGGYFNARTYDVGGIRAGGHGGGTVYTGGGYGGGGGGYYSGGPVYNEEIYRGRACASAPFGYVVGGFGRESRRPPVCHDGARVACRGDDRGGRYGYSERRGCDGGRRDAHYGSYAESTYESHESYEEYSGYGYRDERYADRRPDHGYERRVEYRPHPQPRPIHVQGPPVYVESPPVYVQAPAVHVRPSDVYVEAPHVYLAAPEVSVEAPRVHVEPPRIHQAPPVRIEQPDIHVPAPPPIYVAPMTPDEYYGSQRDAPPPPAPRQHYRQEPGERG
jgi:hypothetical protein